MVYFEARASLFVCLKDKTCPRAEGGGQGDEGACCSAAGAFVALSRASGPRPWLPGLLCGAPFESGRPEPMMRRSASRGSAPLYFVRSRLGVVTEGIFAREVSCRHGRHKPLLSDQLGAWCPAQL